MNSSRFNVRSTLVPSLVAWAALTLPMPGIAQTASSSSLTLDKIKASGEITLGYRESSIPFSYLDDKAQPVGFANDICMKVVEAVKKAVNRNDLKVNLQAVTPANRIPLLTNGTIDIECGSTTNNSARGKQVQFATNYFYSGIKFLVKTGTKFFMRTGIKVESIEDLKGKTIVSTTGTTSYQTLRNLNDEKKLGMELLEAKDDDEGVSMVDSGRAAAFGLDDVLLYRLRAGAQKPETLAVVGDAIQVEPYAIMMRLNDPEFTKLVDDVLAEMMKSGEFIKLYAKWFMSPIPPKGINLNAPMSPELKANLKALSDKPAT